MVVTTSPPGQPAGDSPLTDNPAFHGINTPINTHHRTGYFLQLGHNVGGERPALFRQQLLQKH
ncbi:hypothetical protein [Escherichia coli]|uniref:hypothetical protein n=1 Tax=Escherichia coli TaxID=562 RepID=UPI001E3FB665|nr:hypothetical protein [Escherichia coli]MCC4716936.1 hypothetical protein [Escherichia coli]